MMKSEGFYKACWMLDVPSPILRLPSSVSHPPSPILRLPTPIFYLRPFCVTQSPPCLQHIPASLCDGYVQNLLTWTRPGGRFVVTMHKTDCTAADHLAEAQSLFSRHFDLERTEEEPPANAEMAKHLNSIFHFVHK